MPALHLVYGDSLVYSGPLFRSSSTDGNRIIVEFTHTATGLATTNGEAPREFAIAGADKKFVWANTKIDGNRVIVWSEEVPDPKYVRYAWADNPVCPNLFNKEGLPASPFRTDQ
jgi:sialate O-acetylesterase